MGANLLPGLIPGNLQEELELIIILVHLLTPYTQKSSDLISQINKFFQNFLSGQRHQFYPAPGSQFVADDDYGSQDFGHLRRPI